MTEQEMVDHLRGLGYTVLPEGQSDDLRHAVKSLTLADAAEFVLAGYTRGQTGLQIATKLKTMSRRIYR